jgi:alkylation response protein AidB-like acyl-CoA dehydrogenase
MFSFEPSEEQKMLVDAALKFALKDIREAAPEADEKGQLPQAVIGKGWDLGLLQSSIPEEYGGFGARSAVTLALAAEELAYGDLATAMAILAPNLFALPILIAGSQAQKQTHLPKFCEGGYLPATAALMEPRYDFQPGALKTTAREDRDGWVLDGEKCYVPLAADAEHLLVYAALDGQTQGFIVRKSVPGLSIGEREQNMGIRALPTYTLRLSNCKVACADRLGGEAGHDFAPIINASRAALAAMAVGVSRGAYSYALKYAKEREAFGEPIAQRQSIAFMLSEMATEIEATRLMAWEAAWLIDQGRDATREAYLAKITADDISLMCTDRAVQILGGHGYIRDHPVEMWLRNARGFATFEGLAIV